MKKMKEIMLKLVTLKTKVIMIVILKLLVILWTDYNSSIILQNYFLFLNVVSYIFSGRPYNNEYF
jgi:hypothetical protein